MELCARPFRWGNDVGNMEREQTSGKAMSNVHSQHSDISKISLGQTFG